MFYQLLPTAVDLLDSLRGKSENALLFDGVRGQSEQGGERQQRKSADDCLGETSKQC